MIIITPPPTPLPPRGPQLPGQPRLRPRTFRTDATFELIDRSSSSTLQPIQPQRQTASLEFMCQLDQEPAFACHPGLWSFNELEVGREHALCMSVWGPSPQSGERELIGDTCLVWDILTPGQGFEDILTQLRLADGLDETMLEDLSAYITLGQSALAMGDVEAVIESLAAFQVAVSAAVANASLSSEMGEWFDEMADALIAFLNDNEPQEL